MPSARDVDHLERLLADTDLYERLRETDFSGPDWDYVAVHALIRYSLTVLVAWMRSGDIWRHLAAKNIGALPDYPEWEWNEQTWISLADDTIVVAVTKFRDNVLRTGKWDPRRGASLRTFFIGQCLFQFANVYRSWCRDARRRYDERPGHDEMLPGIPDQRTEPDTEVVRSDEVARELAALDDRTREVLRLREQGFDQYEIGSMLHISRKSVENVIRRQAERGRRRRGA